MDSRLEGLSQEVKGQGFPRQERGQKWTDDSGLCSQIYWGHALSHQPRISAIHADDFTPALSIETMVCTHRELYRTKNILRIREPRIIGPYTESCGFMTHITMAQYETNALMDYRYRPMYTYMVACIISGT